MANDRMVLLKAVDHLTIDMDHEDIVGYVGRVLIVDPNAKVGDAIKNALKGSIENAIAERQNLVNEPNQDEITRDMIFHIDETIKSGNEILKELN